MYSRFSKITIFCRFWGHFWKSSLFCSTWTLNINYLYLQNHNIYHILSSLDFKVFFENHSDFKIRLCPQFQRMFMLCSLTNQGHSDAIFGLQNSLKKCIWLENSECKPIFSLNVKKLLNNIFEFSSFLKISSNMVSQMSFFMINLGFQSFSYCFKSFWNHFKSF